MQIAIENYSRGDRQACLDLFLSNAGIYWQASEIGDLENFLDNEVSEQAVEAYSFKALVDGVIQGSAGFIKTKDAIWIEWVMVHKEFHGEGIGSVLLTHCLNQIAATEADSEILLCTSPLTHDFYIKKGFITESVEVDGYQQIGLDKIKMRYSK